MADPAEKPEEIPRPPMPVEYLLHSLTRVEADLRDLRGELRQLDAKFDAKFDRLDAKFDKLAARFDEKIAGLVGAGSFWGATGLVLATIIGFGAVLVAR
jgi:predicted nuclease with TOPRIM domain